MSVHSSLMSAWPTDLVTAGVVSGTSQVYAGRRPQAVTHQTLEVWLERQPEERGGSGLQHVTSYPYVVHVRRKTNAGGDKTGAAQITTVEAHMQTIAARYHGARRLYASSGLTGVICTTANEGSVDVDPEDEAVLDGTVRVVWHVEE